MVANPHKVLIQFRGTPVYLIIDKADLAAVIYDRKDFARVYTRDPSVTTLFGEAPAEYTGRAELTHSKHGIRLTMKDGRTFFIRKAQALEVLKREEWSCKVSEAIPA